MFYFLSSRLFYFLSSRLFVGGEKVNSHDNQTSTISVRICPDITILKSLKALVFVVLSFCLLFFLSFCFYVVAAKRILQVVATLLWEVRGKDAKEVRSKIREEVGATSCTLPCYVFSTWVGRSTSPRRANIFSTNSSIDPVNANACLPHQVRRWHPDKFTQKLGSRIVPDQKEKVTIVPGNLNNLKAP